MLDQVGVEAARDPAVHCQCELPSVHRRTCHENFCGFSRMVRLNRRRELLCVNILRQSRRLYGCGPLKGAFSQPAMVQESAAAQTRAMRDQTAKNILPEMSNSDSHPGRAGGSPWGNSIYVRMRKRSCH